MFKLSDGKEIKNYVVFDVECLHDVDGKVHKFSESHRLRNAVACTLTSEGEFTDWVGNVHPPIKLFQYLASFDAVVGYNSIGFDYPLLGGELLGEYDLKAPKFIENYLKGKSIDLCIDFREALGVRVGLNKVATATLGESKPMDGGLAPQNWRRGKCLEVITYCRGDVDMTDKLLRKAIAGEQLSVFDTAGNKKQFTCHVKLR